MLLIDLPIKSNPQTNAITSSYVYQDFQNIDFTNIFDKLNTCFSKCVNSVDAALI